MSLERLKKKDIELCGRLATKNETYPASAPETNPYFFGLIAYRIPFVQIFARTYFRAYLFSRIFAQNLNLREIARKLVPNFFNFAHKNKSQLKFSQKCSCFSFLLPYLRFLKFENLKVRENKSARKFLIFAQTKCAKISTREN